MNKQRLLEILRSPEKFATAEFPNVWPRDHHEACDEALLEFIDDPEVTEAFSKHEKWYA
jgi:hypothetical protein